LKRPRATDYYRNWGISGRIARDLEYDASAQWGTLTFVIDEGPRYRIRDLSVVGNKKFDAQQLLDQLKLRQGDYFNLDKMQLDESLLRDAYGSQGHIFADIKASPRFQEEPGQLDLVYQIEEGDVFRVGKIIHVAGRPAHSQDVVLNRRSLRQATSWTSEWPAGVSRPANSSPVRRGTPPRIVIRPPDLAKPHPARNENPRFGGRV
jgi:outer membrane protein insertion porin family